MNGPTIPLISERDVLAAALDQIRSRLPEGWTLDRQVEGAGRRQPDALVVLGTTEGSAAAFAVEAKRSLVRRDLPAVMEQLEHQIASLSPNGRASDRPLPLVVARYLAAPVQNWLTDRGVAYADATGNLRVTLQRPPFFLRDVGASKDPWRGPGRPKGNLTGEPAARVVRTLVDYRPPYSVPSVVELAGTSTGPTYRVVDFLNDQALLSRSERGAVEEVRWRELLQRWSQDYGFLRNNAVTSWLAPRGLPTVIQSLTQRPTGQPRYAMTGSIAAQTWAPYAPARAAMIYADDPPQLAKQLDLRAVDSGANVLIASPAYDVVYDRSVEAEGLRIVSPSQAAVDLTTGPGRNPAEGEALLDWMEANTNAWRR